MTARRSRDAFERDLAQAARAIADESLPAGVLDVPLPRVVRRGGLADVVRRALPAAAVVAAVIVIAIGFGGLRQTGPAALPVLRSTVAIANQLRGGGWTCSENVTQSGLRSSSPRVALPDALVCTAPATMHPIVAALTVDESTPGTPSGISIKADILGTSNGTLETRRTDLLYLAIGLPFGAADDAAAARAWLKDQRPLAPGASTSTTIDGLPVHLAWMVGGGELIEIGAVATPH